MDGLDAVKKIEALKPDVVVLERYHAGAQWFRSGTAHSQKLPKVAIVILSTNADRQFIDEARKIGVRAYVPKSEAAAALVKAVEAAIRNDGFFVVD